jgi:hypothetical protein
MSLVVVHCPNCWIEYAIPPAMDRKLLEMKAQKSVFCPNGHQWHYTGEREVDIERRKRQLAEQACARLEEEARKAIHERNAAQRDLKRHRTRSKAGLCPCCNRSFVNMQQHMKTKHPDYNVVPIKDASK